MDRSKLGDAVNKFIDDRAEVKAAKLAEAMFSAAMEKIDEKLSSVAGKVVISQEKPDVVNNMPPIDVKPLADVVEKMADNLAKTMAEVQDQARQDLVAFREALAAENAKHRQQALDLAAKNVAMQEQFLAWAERLNDVLASIGEKMAVKPRTMTVSKDASGIWTGTVKE